VKTVAAIAVADSLGALARYGLEGFGADSHLHTSRILRLSEDLPVVIELVDTAERMTR
jgi:hypothetical protein